MRRTPHHRGEEWTAPRGRDGQYETVWSVFLRFIASPPPSPITFSLSSPFPSSSTFSSPPLFSFPSLLSSQFTSYVRPRVSTASPVPAQSQLPPPFPSYICSFAFNPIIVPAPSACPPSFEPTFPQPRPRYSLRPRPRLRSCPRLPALLPDPQTRLPLRYDARFTDTGPCKRSCRVPASATPCLQKW